MKWPLVVLDVWHVSAYVHGCVGVGGVCASPGCADVLSEASPQPFSSAVSQCSAAPQCLRAGLLRAGPQHPAALWYANDTHTFILHFQDLFVHKTQNSYIDPHWEVRCVNRVSPCGWKALWILMQNMSGRRSLWQIRQENKMPCKNAV